MALPEVHVDVKISTPVEDYRAAIASEFITDEERAMIGDVTDDQIQEAQTKAIALHRQYIDDLARSVFTETVGILAYGDPDVPHAG